MSVLYERLHNEMRKQVEYGRKPSTYGEYSQLLFECMGTVGYTDGTIRNYRHISSNHIYPYIENISVANISVNELKCIYNSMYEENLCYLYRAIVQTLFKHVFCFAMKIGAIEEDPSENIRVKM